MIISHKYKFIFIKTGKVAGTSIEVFLSQRCGEDDVVTPIHPYVSPHRPRNYLGRWNPVPEMVAFAPDGARKTLEDWRQRKIYYHHLAARRIYYRTSRRVWNTYFKFCVDRNPWDKTVSNFFMLNSRRASPVSFDHFVRNFKLPRNFPLYTDRRGRVMVDRILRYEDLNAELAEVFDRLGVPFDGDLGVRAKGEHRTGAPDYRAYFDEALKAIVADGCQDEIALNGYRF